MKYYPWVEIFTLSKQNYTHYLKVFTQIYPRSYEATPFRSTLNMLYAPPIYPNPQWDRRLLIVLFHGISFQMSAYFSISNVDQKTSLLLSYTYSTYVYMCRLSFNETSFSEYTKHLFQHSAKISSQDAWFPIQSIDFNNFLRNSRIFQSKSSKENAIFSLNFQDSLI